MTHALSAPHELAGNLLFDQHGDSPYWATRKIIQAFGGGANDLELKIGGEPWRVSVDYQRSGLDPRPSDDVDQLCEYRINCYGRGERKLLIVTSATR